MTRINDILQSEELKANPFTMPQGYLESLEASVSARIEAESQKSSRPVWFTVRRVLKPAVSLAAMFILIFGIGYGALSLTGTLRGGDSVPAEAASDGIALIDAGLLSSSFIDYYVEDMAYFEEPVLSDEDIFEYLSRELSYGDLAELYTEYYSE